MRSRLAVLSVLTLALAAIAIPLSADASIVQQTVIERVPVPPTGIVLGLDTVPQFFLTVAEPSAIRVTALPDHSIRIEIRALPNPAAFRTSSRAAEETRPSTVAISSLRIGFEPASSLRRSTIEPLPLPVSAAYRNERWPNSSGLRDASLNSTLVKGRYIRS